MRVEPQPPLDPNGKTSAHETARTADWAITSRPELGRLEDRVLVADDSPDVTERWAFQLTRAGYQVEQAHGPRQTQMLIRKGGFDVVVLKQAWLDACPPVAVPIVVVGSQVTGSRLPEVRACIEAPAEPATVLSCVDGLLRQHTSASSSEPLRSSVSLRHIEGVPWPETGSLDEQGRRIGTISSGVGFAALMGTLVRREFAGVLLLRRGPIKKMVHFLDGRPVRVRSNLLTECLGQQMIANRLISGSACSEALELKKNSGRRFGETLVAMGEISQQNLAFALQHQMNTKLLELFSWRDGQYLAIPDNPKIEEIPMELSTAALIYEGLKAHADTATLLEALLPLGRYHIDGVDQNGRDVASAVDAETWRAIETSDRTELSALVGEAGTARAERARLLLTLGMAGHCRLRGAPYSPPMSASSPVLGRGLVYSGVGSNPSSALQVDTQEPQGCEEVASDENGRPPRGLSFGTQTLVPSEDSSFSAVLSGHDLGPEALDEVLGEVEERALGWLSGYGSEAEATTTRVNSQLTPAEPNRTLLVEPEIASEKHALSTADLEDEALAFERLRERYAAVAELSFRDRLGLGSQPITIRLVEDAYIAARSRLEADILSDSHLSARCAHLAEAAMVVLDDARAGLLNEDVRRRTQPSSDGLVPWLAALESFENGLLALRRGDEEGAHRMFCRAAELDPTVGEYGLHAEACDHTTSVVDHPLRRLMVARTAQPQEAQEAWKSVLELDPDQPEALVALRAPAVRNRGFLSWWR